MRGWVVWRWVLVPSNQKRGHNGWAEQWDLALPLHFTICYLKKKSHFPRFLAVGSFEIFLLSVLLKHLSLRFAMYPLLWQLSLFLSLSTFGTLWPFARLKEEAPCCAHRHPLLPKYRNSPAPFLSCKTPTSRTKGSKQWPWYLDFKNCW